MAPPTLSFIVCCPTGRGYRAFTWVLGALVTLKLMHYETAVALAVSYLARRTRIGTHGSHRQ